MVVSTQWSNGRVDLECFEEIDSVFHIFGPQNCTIDYDGKFATCYGNKMGTVLLTAEALLDNEQSSMLCSKMLVESQ